MTAIASIITGVFALAGTITAAVMAARSKQKQLEHPDWPEFARALQSRVEAQDRKIDELFAMVGDLRGELREERHRSNIMVGYLRLVLRWAVEDLGTDPPAPPDDLYESVSDIVSRG